MSNELVINVKDIVSETIKGIVINKNELFPEFEEIKTLRKDVDAIKNTKLIEPHDQLAIQHAVNRRVSEIATEYSWDKLRRFIFADIYRMLKVKFDVPRYSYIKLLEKDKAMTYINEYKPTDEFIERMQLKKEKQ